LPRRRCCCCNCRRLVRTRALEAAAAVMVDPALRRCRLLHRRRWCSYASLRGATSGELTTLGCHCCLVQRQPRQPQRRR
jgi:hypothetical protein